MKDTSLRTERDIEFTLHLPVLAMVPAIERLPVRKPDVLVATTPEEAGVGAGGRA
jgi:hypothetical protein